MSSVLPQEVHSALSQLLLALASPDNVVRSQAEEQLNNDWVPNRRDVLLMGLAEHLQGAEDKDTRSFAAVLFRRIAGRSIKDPNSTESKELFFTILQEQRLAIREKLLQSLNGESVAAVRNKVGDAIAEIAGQYATNVDETWPELLGVLFQASQSADYGLRDSAFRIFSATPGIIEKQHEEMVTSVFSKGFQDENISVRISAIGAFVSFFRSIPKKSQSKYASLAPDMLNVLPPLKEAGANEELSKAFVSLIELAELSSKIFRGLFNNLVKFSISVIGDTGLEPQVRQDALELMATFAEYAPSMCKKDPDYAQDMVTQCLNLMTDVGEDDDDAAIWSANEDLEESEESDTNHVAGEQCMDRLANKLRGQVILPATFTWIPRMMSSTSWRDRHAALMAISAISEGCRDMMLGELDQVLGIVVPALQDSHPRVRFAGCNALGQMSTDFAGTMQEKYHSIVMETLIPTLSSDNPRVQAHAAAALVNFCEESEPAILEPYLANLLRNLLELLRSNKRFVQEQALSTIATIADSAETAFGQYYDTLMPLLFNVLKEEQTKEYQLLRAKAMECATLIALAVGKTRMGQDALSLVQLLGNIQQNIVDADDPKASYLLHCWGRMCRVLGADFVPYLPAVMPPLLQVASAKADVQILDHAQIDEVEQDDNWELVPLKEKVIGIRTSALEDKNTAIELITIYAQVLEAAFEPYVIETLDTIAIPSLAFFFHDPVRISSAKLVPRLLNSYKKAHGDRSPEFIQMWQRTAEKLIEILAAEPAIDTLAEMFQCFYESVEVAGNDSLGPQHMQAFIQSSKSTLEDYRSRVKRRLDEKADVEEGDDDALSVEYEVEEDQNLLSDMNKAFHTVFKNQGASFLPAWESLLPFFDEFATSQDATQRQWALCIMDDVLEFCGEASWNYKDHMIQPLINGAQDENPANRQAAAYGIGAAAQKGGMAWSEFAAASIPLLLQLTRHPQAREDDHVFATENGSTSIAKILHFNSSKVQNPMEVVDSWIDTLPVVNDEEAAPYAYSFLAQLIDQQNQSVLAKADKAFTHIVLALEAETIQGAVASKVVSSAKQLVAATGVNAEQILSSIRPENQMNVRRHFDQEAPQPGGNSNQS